MAQSLRAHKTAVIRLSYFTVLHQRLRAYRYRIGGCDQASAYTMFSKFSALISAFLAYLIQILMPSDKVYLYITGIQCIKLLFEFGCLVLRYSFRIVANCIPSVNPKMSMSGPFLCIYMLYCVSALISLQHREAEIPVTDNPRQLHFDVKNSSIRISRD